MILLPTGLETAPTGTINPTGIFNGDWEILNNIFDPTHVGAQAGVLAAALAGMTTLTYGATTTVALNTGRPLQVVTLTGDTTLAITEKVAGRSRRVIIVGDGTARALTWPVGAVWAGPAVTTLPINKTAVVDIVATGTTDASLVLTSVSRFDFVTAGDLAAFATLTGSETLQNKALALVTKMTLAASAYVELTTSRAATDADNGKILWSQDAGEITLTFPDSLTKPFGCGLKQEGAGRIKVEGSGTAVIRNIDGHTRTGGQWTSASIDYRAGNDVVFIGRTAGEDLDAMTEAWLAALTTAGGSATAAQIAAMDAFFVAMDAGGFVAGVKAMIVPMWDVPAANLINIFDPTGPAITAFGTLTHASHYMASNGTTGYVNMIASTTAAGIGFLNCYFAANVAPGFTTSSGYMLSGFTTGPSYMSLQILDLTQERYLTTGASTLTGLATPTNDLSGTTLAYQGASERGVVGIPDGGSLLSTHTTAVSATDTDKSIFGLANSNAGSPADYSTLPVRCLMVGNQSLSSTQAETLAGLIDDMVNAVLAGA